MGTSWGSYAIYKELIIPKNHGRNDEVQISKGKQKGKGFGSCVNVDFEGKEQATQRKGKA